MPEMARTWTLLVVGAAAFGLHSLGAVEAKIPRLAMETAANSQVLKVDHTLCHYCYYPKKDPNCRGDLCDLQSYKVCQPRNPTCAAEERADCARRRDDCISQCRRHLGRQTCTQRCIIRYRGCRWR